MDDRCRRDTDQGTLRGQQGMKRRDVLMSGGSLAAASALTGVGLATPAQAQQPQPTPGGARRPNIVVILADDLGNADLGYRGSDIKTPNIDRLAARACASSHFYGQPVCTPARAALMTGRYPMRHGLQTLVIFPSHTYGLPTDERTLPQALKDVGYRTAMVGKWHLGHADQKYWPQNRGFDHFYGNLVGEVDYFTKDRGGLIDWQRNGKFLKEDGYYTDLIGDEAVRLIERARQRQSLVPLRGVAGCARSLSSAAEADRPLCVDPGKEPPNLCGHAQRVGRPGRSHRGGARKEGHAREHDHHLQLRQRRRDQRPVRDRSAIRRGAQGKRRRGAGRQASRLEWRTARRQRLALRRRRTGAHVCQLAGQAQAARGERAAAHGERDAHLARRSPEPRAAQTTRSMGKTCGRHWRRAGRRPTTTS